MKKKNFIILVACLICMLIPNAVLAHPGRTDGNGCHRCKTNCSQWGLSQGQYHCHDGSSSQEKSNNNTNNQAYINKKIPKSGDNTLKLITIDGEDIEISDKMNYKTKKEKIDILVKPNDAKAIYKIDNNTLNIGENTIHIMVTAENGNVKEYSIEVDREKLSNNTNIKVMVEEEIKFVFGKADVSVSSDVNALNYKYELEDKNSKVNIDGDKNLKQGKNIVTFNVVAEDGTEAKYELTVNKKTKIDETIETIVGLVVMGGIGFGIYYLVKRRKV